MTDTPETKRGRGRPSEYRPEFANEIVELMGTGLSLTAAMASLGFSRETARLWEKERPDFLGTIALGHAKRSLALEKIGLQATSGPAVTFVLKALANCNRDDFRDRVEHAGDAENPVSFVLRLPSKAENTEAWLKQE